jgi:cytochrome c553
MTKHTIAILALLFLASLAAAARKSGDTRQLPPAATGRIDFKRDIQPIFARACLSCHGAKKHKAGLRLDSGKTALEGSYAGPVIIPRDALRSRLLHVVAGLDPDLKMPPRGKSLTRVEIGRLRAWIEQGAPWPADASVPPLRKPTHWAFLPVKRPMVPSVSHPTWLRNEIDGFILARLEKKRIQPAPEADKTTLIRRLSFDLIGLPPSPQEVEAFVRDERPDAYERLVERLLASPHYGERWGRHWLDLARYADSNGFEKDRERPHSWRYRHWVIAALNRDLPFDRFTIEQLAGDLLPRATLEQKEATGFHRNTLTNEECGVDKEQFRVEQTVDRVNTTATVFLGLTLGCAQCHDHKYDPLSQREYYQFFAFFNGLDEKDVVAPLPGEWEPYRKAKAEFDRMKADLEGGLADFKQKQLPGNQEKWERGLTPGEIRKLPKDIRTILAVPARKRSAKQKKTLTAFYGPMDMTLGILTAILDDHLKKAPTISMAPVLVEGKGRKTHILLRGDFLKPGAHVQPAVPAVLQSLHGRDLSFRLRSSTRNDKSNKSVLRQPNRLDLARWLVDPANPLTTRVAVNRLWQHHFGRGLVRTSEDFGTRGEKPSLPELHDWLATELVRRQWSQKAMHRLIVLSAAYRQSSAVRSDLAKSDPHNLLLARQNRLRLEAEAIRDAALTASGLLYRPIGGPSVRPPQPEGIAEITFSDHGKWIESKGPARYQRGLYTFFRRTSPYPTFLTFDAPDASLACTRRRRSNTPLQALVLLNDTVYVEAAQALARRVVREESGGIPTRIEHAFHLCLARAPSPREARRLAELFAAQLTLCKADRKAAALLAGKGPVPERISDPELASWVAVARIVMNLDEFITRE